MHISTTLSEFKQVSLKLYLLCAFSLGLCQCLYAQKGKDIVYLKNGTLIKGTIIGQDSGITKIQTKDGNIFAFTESEIKILINYKNYKEAKRDSKKREEAILAAKRDSKRKFWRLEVPKILVGLNAYPTMSLNAYGKEPWASPYSGYPNREGYVQNSPRAGFSGGFSFAYDIHQIGFETGLFYRTDAMGVIIQNPVSTNNGGVITYGGASEKQFARYHSIGIPLLFNMMSKGKKVRFIASIGFSVGVTLLYTFTDNYFGNYSYPLPLFKGDYISAYPFSNPREINNNVNTTISDYRITLRYWDPGVSLQAQMGIEVNISRIMLLRVSPAIYGTLNPLVVAAGGLNIQLLFNEK